MVPMATLTVAPLVFTLGFLAVAASLCVYSNMHCIVYSHLQQDMIGWICAYINARFHSSWTFQTGFASFVEAS